MGKSWLIKRLARKLVRYGHKVIVYSGVADTDFPKGVKLTFDHDVFERMLNDSANYGAHIFVDEATILFNKARSSAKYPAIHQLASAGRHKGFTAYFATQRPTRLIPDIRENCSQIYAFRLRGKKACQIVYEDCGEAKINGKRIDEIIIKQKQLEFVHVDMNKDIVVLGKL